MPRPFRILIVEDEFLLAADLMQSLEAAGYAIAGPAPSVRVALETIAAGPPDAAILDIQLTDGKSFSVARKLAELGRPFVFLTSFSRDALPDDLEQVPHISKLDPLSDVLKALQAALDDEEKPTDDTAGRKR
ncbi:response regulator [Sinorhizobium sp. NFACC03]|uniref:response regulator n=1 Tax=Sinorhizobium sp. NFACC03 TaxID=1566295 RepID=UPI0008827685|nr:response regulator [Sinorhizobium sp. NFACC03]SDA93744.1 Response regulator receiver domain-containing protein [Sinorhizobium sp. NFACC03]